MKNEERFDPFPNLSFARKFLWRWLDHAAYRRVLRLGVPSPWDSFHRGYQQAVVDLKIQKLEEYPFNLKYSELTQPLPFKPHSQLIGEP